MKITLNVLTGASPPYGIDFSAAFLLSLNVTFVLLSGTTQSNENIVVAYSGISGFQGPLWTFSELRLFAKYNLNPEIVLIAGGAQSMQALLSNYTHFALASAAPRSTNFPLVW